MKKIDKVILFILVMLFSCNILNVKADMISIDDVLENKDSELLLWDEFLTFRKIDSDKIGVYSFEEEKLFEFNYNEEYMYYSNNSIINEDNVNKNIEGVNLAVPILLETMFRVLNYDKTLSEDIDFNDISYDEYGIEIITEDYNFIGSDGIRMRGGFLRSFKISFDEEKIVNFADEYGIDYEIESGDENNLLNDYNLGWYILRNDYDSDSLGDIDIELSLGNVTDKSITVRTTLNPSYANVQCEIMKSSSLNGFYEHVHIELCGNEFIDDDLESNTTYYYKVRLFMSSNESNIASATTKASQTNNNDENEENPETGADLKKGPLAILFVGGLIIMLYPRRKYLHKF